MKRGLSWAIALLATLLLVSALALAWVIEFGSLDARLEAGAYTAKVPGLDSLVGKALVEGAPFRRRQARQQLLKEAQAAVQARLRDPESARFRSLHVDDPALDAVGTFMSVCGEVNAKNGLGGYSGFEPFHYRGGPDPALLMLSDDPEVFAIVARECLPVKR